MGKESIRIILTERRDIGGILRNPGYVLLEGVSPENLAANDVGESIRLGQVKVEVVKSRNVGEEAP